MRYFVKNAVTLCSILQWEMQSCSNVIFVGTELQR